MYSIPDELSDDIARSAFAFRGYDVKNLGRTPELYGIDPYRALMDPFLREASEECADALGRPVDLAARIREGVEMPLEDYTEIVAMIVAVEQAQIAILRECHGIDYAGAAFGLGFSLGEIGALVAGGTFGLADALRVPLSLCEDGVVLAADVTLGIVFSRKEELSLDRVKHTLLEINQRGEGVIGISAHLSPNSVLVMGTGKTIGHLKARLKEDFPAGTNLRCNDSKWPPLHTPIVWEKDFTTRAARQLHTNPGGFGKPDPDILSMVTGEFSYDGFNAREHMIRWVDQTLQLWKVVCAILSSDVTCIVHVGPAPNIIPSTFERLARNVEAQTTGSRGMKALAAVSDRPWLRRMLPNRAALLRAPRLEHIILEDWLVERAPES